MSEKEAPETRSDEQRDADEFQENSKPRHPVIAAAEEKLAAMERGEYIDVERHEQIRRAHGLASPAGMAKDES